MQNSQHFHLDTPQTLALRLGAGDMVHVTQGCIWLTLEGHSRDVWLNAHDAWSVPLNAKVWVSSDSLAVFTVSRPTPLKTDRRPVQIRYAEPSANRWGSRAPAKG